jgi:hypothetical protein
MSKDSPVTLSTLFDDLQPHSPRVEVAKDEDVTTVLKKTMNAVEWTASSSILIPKIAELLDIKLSTILVAFWRKADKLAAALRETRDSPNRTIDLSLEDSSTEATFEPWIEVRLAGASAGKKIRFTIAIPLTLEAVEVRIKNGAIISALAGACEVSGSLKLETIVLAKLKEPVKVPLSPRMHFD